jgi:hypothetical protein
MRIVSGLGDCASFETKMKMLVCSVRKTPHPQPFSPSCLSGEESYTGNGCKSLAQIARESEPLELVRELGQLGQFRPRIARLKKSLGKYDAMSNAKGPVSKGRAPSSQRSAKAKMNVSNQRRKI